MTPEEWAAISTVELRDELLRRGDLVLLAILQYPPAGADLVDLIWAHKGPRWPLIGLAADLQARLIADTRADSL